MCVCAVHKAEKKRRNNKYKFMCVNDYSWRFGLQTALCASLLLTLMSLTWAQIGFQFTLWCFFFFSSLRFVSTSCYLLLSSDRLLIFNQMIWDSECGWDIEKEGGRGKGRKIYLSPFIGIIHSLQPSHFMSLFSSSSSHFRIVFFAVSQISQ